MAHGRLLLLSCMVLGGLMPAQDRPLVGAARTAFTGKIASRMAGIDTVVASFEQEKHYALFDEVVKQRGVILYRRPDRLRWEIRQPFRSILIVAGNAVAKFEYRKDQRQKLRLGRAKDVLLIVMDQIRGWFRGDFEQGATDYHVDVYDGPPTRIVMRPKGKALRRSIRSIELRLAPQLDAVTQVTIDEQGGDRTVMKFRRQPTGKALDPAYFDVDDPRDYTPPPKPPAKQPPAKQPPVKRATQRRR